MSKPVIVTVDDDAAVSAAIARDLRTRYGSDYRIVRTTSGQQALDAIDTVLLRGQMVALIVSDQRMPGLSGIETLLQARTKVPGAKQLLLTAYADTSVAISAINDIGLDYYLLKPWDPPEEKLYPVVDDLLGDWQRAHPDHSSDVTVVGHRWSERSYDIKTFLVRNHVPYRWLDIERDEEARRLAEAARATAGDLPLVMVPDAALLKTPTTLDVAGALGLRTAAQQPLYDVCIVGGGPAGLAAAVYAASEGLSTVIVEREAPGGQAGTSAAIENYLGFPKGLTGSDLTQRAVAQVTRFGAEMVLAREVSGVQMRGPVRAALLDGQGEIEARSLIVASGVSYRRLTATGLEAMVGRGVYYGATASEASQCSDDEVFVVGAANSAGQAVLSLARYAKRVVMVVRGPSLEASMSRYLVDRILATDNIEVLYHSEIDACLGDGHLERVAIIDRDSGERHERSGSWLFIFIGATPRTDWLGSEIARDAHGFVLTGQEVTNAPAGDPAGPGAGPAPGPRTDWSLARPPLSLETSVPGVFAAGDVRLGSMKRVASAVGEGAMAVYQVHRYLATI